MYKLVALFVIVGLFALPAAILYFGTWGTVTTP